MNKGTTLTKEYFDKRLDSFVTKNDFNKTVSSLATKDELSKEIRSIRSAMHGTLVTTLDNMKEYYKEETERYLGVLMENSRNELVVMKENLSILNNRFYDHEERITMLETA